MGVETSTTTVWTCDVKGCAAQYEGKPPLGDVPPIGFAIVRYQLGKDYASADFASGVFCETHSAHVREWLEGVRKSKTS